MSSRSAIHTFRSFSFSFLISAALVNAAEYYVSPSGGGSGSISSPWSLGTALSTNIVRPGDTIWLRGGTYYGSFTSYLTGTAAAPIVLRQYPGERAVIDGSTAPGESTFNINGSYAKYWGFEVMNSNPIRILGITGSLGRDAGVVINGPNNKVINLVVHDTGQGISFWSPAFNSELYGNIVFYNGWDGLDRGHGHGVYVQNQTGSKTMADNIVFDQFSFGFHAYSETNYINNLTFDGNFSFNNGAPSFSGYTNNILVSATNVALNPVVQNNATYYTPSVGTGLNTISNCSNANINGNTFVSGYFAISLPTCVPTTMAGNSFRGNTPGWIASAYPNNTYLGSHPTGVKIIVRPNRYEAGRANIAIYNWDRLSSVNVDLSTTGLGIGQPFEIRDVQNYFGAPLLRGMYTGSPVAIPMSGLVKAPPIGSVNVVPPHTAPEFGVFVVLPTGPSPGGGDTTPPTVAITTPGAGATVTGSISVTASASDNVGVAGVQFRIDGNVLGNEVASPPYTTLWNTGTVSNGNHTITATARDASGNQASSAVTVNVSNTVTSGPTFVTSTTLGTIRSNYSGWVGMSVTVGATPIAVASLGRIFAPGNTGTHPMKIVAAGTGADVPGSTIALNMSGGIAGSYMYGPLASPVTLSANTTYYILSLEAAGGDQWYDYDTTVQTASVAMLNGRVYGTGAPYASGAGSGHMYGPVDFTYSTAAPPPVSATPFVTSKTLGTARSNYSGWVGMSVTVGAAPIAVASLGRIFVPGNTATHSMKIVAASTGTDLPGSTITLSLSGGIAGSFVYGALTSPVTLNANTTYYVLSQETSGGDQWYDYDTTAQTANVATLNGRVYGTSAPYSAGAGSAGHMYGPVDFTYSTAAPPPVIGTAFVTSKTLGGIRSNYSGWVGMSVSVGPTPITVTALGRIFVLGNTGLHSMKIVAASTGADLPGSTIALSVSGGTAGSFVYGALPSPVTLNANTTYYILSQETSGGDQWYDHDTTAQTSSVATLIGAVYGGSAPYTTVDTTGHMYVPVDFKFTSP